MQPDTCATAVSTFCDRHYRLLRCGVVAIALFNLMFRLGREVVYEWDEALYAIAAWEIQESGEWIGTTFFGALDYYNTKPPLNVWLIALAFKAFGRNLVSLRFVSAGSALLTVVALQEFARRLFGSAVALLAGAVLATTFAFVYVHSGRTAETDALFTLLVLMIVITLWAEQRQPWMRAGVGLLTGAVFLLRGMAVLMPLLIVFTVWLRARSSDWRLRVSTSAACVLFIVPVGTWTVLRWRVDRWRFFERLFNYDFVARSVTTIEGHAGTPFYYLNILLKHEYEWVAAAFAGYVLFPIGVRQLRALLAFWRDADPDRTILGSWAVVTALLPSVMVTKLPWYLNPFYPVFALAVAWIIARGLLVFDAGPHHRARRTILAAIVAMVFCVAEGKLIWYSYHHRDMRRSIQRVFLAHRLRLHGHQVFRHKWDNAEIFIVGGVVGAQWRVGTIDDFSRESRPGDCFVSPRHAAPPALVPLASHGHEVLSCRPD